jgi:hypothetical protein
MSDKRDKITMLMVFLFVLIGAIVSIYALGNIKQVENNCNEYWINQLVGRNYLIHGKASEMGFDEFYGQRNYTKINFSMGDTLEWR